MQTYLDLLRHVLEHGAPKADRTGTGTRSVFGYQMRFDLARGFPLLTTKRVHFKSVAYELLWFLRGDTNIHWLHEHGVTIWDEWADARGDLGPVYGKQWRDWGGCDQIASVLDHALFQFYVAGGRLSCQLYQRSADVFLGVPFNIASYALLIHMRAQQADLQPGELVWTGGDVHLYNNHLAQAETQLSREPYPLPTLELRHASNIDAYQYSDITLQNYQSHPAIPAPVAV